MAGKPRIKNTDPLYLLLRDGKITEFNQQIAKKVPCDLTDCDFRHVDLRGLIADGLDFTGGYFRQADLRGIDFRYCRLEGASIYGAKISGVYFPSGLSPAEIGLSLSHGTRMRYR